LDISVIIAILAKSLVYEHRFFIPIQLESSDLLIEYDSGTLRKLSLKINVKLGGLNYRILDVVREEFVPLFLS
jgi:hypothetical protein